MHQLNASIVMKKVVTRHENPFDLNIQIESLDSKVIIAFEKISQAFRVMLWDKAKEYGISPIQIQLMIHIKNHHPNLRKVTSLAIEFNMTKATISDALRTLENKNLISRTPEKHDYRSFVFSLTSSGFALVENVENYAESFMEVLMDIDPKEKEALYLQLIQLIQKFNQQEVLSPVRMCLTCTHFSKEKSKGAYCHFLELKLNVKDLRVDCTVHEPIEEI